MRLVRWSHTATLLSDNRVLVTGGSGDATAELYDPAAGAFSPATSMSAARWFQTATRLSDGRILIAGGNDGSVDLATTDLYAP